MFIQVAALGTENWGVLVNPPKCACTQEVEQWGSIVMWLGDT